MSIFLVVILVGAFLKQGRMFPLIDICSSFLGLGSRPYEVENGFGDQLLVLRNKYQGLFPYVVKITTPLVFFVHIQ